MKKKVTLTLVVSFWLLFNVPIMRGQETPDLAKILGDWELEVDAGGGEYYYLSLLLEEADSLLSGLISESQGFFSDVPLSNIQYDGQVLSFEFTAPTPPDGVERLIVAEFTVGDDRMEGYLTLPELGVSAPTIAKRNMD